MTKTPHISTPHQISQPQDTHIQLSDHSEIWQVPRQQCCPGTCQISEWYHHIDRLVQERCNSIANALELRLSCINPSILTSNLTTSRLRDTAIFLVCNLEKLDHVIIRHHYTILWYLHQLSIRNPTVTHWAVEALVLSFIITVTFNRGTFGLTT